MTGDSRRVLLVGESWTTHSIHQKGFDSFTTTTYEEGADALRNALGIGGFEVTYQPAHVAMREFPSSIETLSPYACIILSDIGSNSLLIHPETFSASRRFPDRVQLLADYVRAGGGLVMIGGYLSFQGIEAKARWRDTPVGDVLPVDLLPGDDRVEVPSGVTPTAVGEHPVLDGIDGPWPEVLGYNRVVARPGAQVLAWVGGDPLLVVGEAGQGRAVAFASDCAPHWAPPEFLDWEHYARLWVQIAGWAGQVPGVPVA